MILNTFTVSEKALFKPVFSKCIRLLCFCFCCGISVNKSTELAALDTSW
jgi:hypothetical protein